MEMALADLYMQRSPEIYKPLLQLQTSETKPPKANDSLTPSHVIVLEFPINSSRMKLLQE